MNFMWKNGPNINVGGHKKTALLAVFLSHKVNNKKTLKWYDMLPYMLKQCCPRLWEGN